MLLHLNDSQRKTVLRALDSRLNGIGRRRAGGTLKAHDEADALLCVQLRRELVEAGRAQYEPARPREVKQTATNADEAERARLNGRESRFALRVRDRGSHRLRS